MPRALRIQLLFILLLVAPTTRAQQAANPMARYRRALASARTDSARGRLNMVLSLLSESGDSTRYFALQAISQLNGVLLATKGIERRRLSGILGYALNDLAVSYDNGGNWSRGVYYYRQALPFLLQSDNVPAQVQTLSNLASTYTEQREYLLALRYFEQGVRLGERVPAARQSLATCVARLGILQHYLGNNSVALRYQRRGVQLLEQLAQPATAQSLDFNLRETLVHSQAELAETYLDAFGDTVQANYYSRRAQQLAPHSPCASRTNALAVRGYVLQWQKQWVPARAILLAAQTSALHEHDGRSLAKIWNNLALGEENTGHLALALHYAQQASAIGQGNKPANKSRSAEILTRLYEKLGYPQQALVALKHFMVLRDSVNNENTRRKVLGQALRYDYERRTTSLRATQAVAAANLHRQRVLLWAQLAGLGMLGLLAGQQWRNRRRQQQANTLLAAQKTQIEAQAQRLGELDEAKNQFFANVSHELRTPLTLILGPLEGLLSAPPRPLPAAVQQPIALAYRHAQRLRELVNRILDLTKLQAGRLALQPVPTSVAALLRRVVAQFESLAAQRGVSLHYPTTLSEELRLLVDADKVEQILTNLLINALNHTPAGGRVLVEAQGPAADGQYTISVQDTGPGIALAEQTRIFERYYQSPQGQTQGGTGLGLALSQELTQLLGGTLTLFSTPGQGAAFTLRFPTKVLPAEAAAAVDARPMRADLPATEAAPVDSDQRPFVLVVEDQPDLRDYLRQLLAPTCRVLTASDGQAALDLLSQAPAVELVVTDAMMPRLTGTELLTRLRAAPASIPVLMLTARADEAHRLTALTLGVDDYLTKPFVAAELLARVRVLLARQQVRRTFVNQPSEVDTELSHQQSADALLADAVAQLAATVALAPTPVGQLPSQLTRWQALATEHLGNEQFGPAELASLLCLSERTLYRRLGELAGLTPAAWLRELRLDKARRLLEAGDFQSVTAVATAAGFGRPRYFAELYAERFGCRPSSYQR